MITRPEMRWLIYSCLYDLWLIGEGTQRGEVCQWDGRHLSEMFNVIADVIGHDASEADLERIVGTVLFDIDEGRALRDLLDTYYDDNQFYKLPEERMPYFRTDEWLAVVRQGIKCMGLMMAAGRGLPGWDIVDGEVVI